MTHIGGGGRTWEHRFCVRTACSRCFEGARYCGVIDPHRRRWEDMGTSFLLSNRSCRMVSSAFFFFLSVLFGSAPLHAVLPPPSYGASGCCSCRIRSCFLSSRPSTGAWGGRCSLNAHMGCVLLYVVWVPCLLHVCVGKGGFLQRKVLRADVIIAAPRVLSD